MVDLLVVLSILFAAAVGSTAKGLVDGDNPSKCDETGISVAVSPTVVMEVLFGIDPSDIPVEE